MQIHEKLVFRMLDRHGYGELSIAIFENDLMGRGDEIPEDLDEVFQAMDLNRDGYISYASFLAFTMPDSLISDLQLLRATFNLLDLDRDGVINSDDLGGMFGHCEESEICQDIVRQVSSDGLISWECFVEMMKK